MNRPQIKYYCDLFAPHMTFKSKSQRYEFNKKMTQNWAKQDAAEPGRDNLSYELFKLCIHLQRELDSRPAQAVTEKEPETIPEVLDAYARQIDSIPTRFTHPSMMEECHELVWRMAEHLEKIEETSDGADEERASELFYELTAAEDAIKDTFGVSVQNYKSLQKPKKTFKIIYSPQSHEDYIRELDKVIEENPYSHHLRQHKAELLANAELKALLKHFGK